MTFLLLHISLWIAFAVLVGAAIGWMLRKLTAEEQTEALHSQERRRQAELEATRAALTQAQQQAAAAKTLQQKAEADLAALELSRPVDPQPPPETEDPKRVALRMELQSVREELHVTQVELHEAQKQAQKSPLGPSPVELQVAQAKAATLELKLGESKQRRRELDQELEALRLELAALRREQDLPASEATQLDLMTNSSSTEQQLHAARSRLEELEAAHQELLAEHTERLAAAGEAIAPEWLLEEPEGRPDDLKRIKGIGPVLSATLNRVGIYHFHQLAQLDAPSAAWLAAQLGTFPGRIFRDRWSQQARELSGS